MLGGVTDQPAGRPDFVHDVIAGVDARRAGDTLVLQTLADIDAGRTDLYTERAIDAIALSLRGWRSAATGAARFAAPFIVGNDQRVLVEHGALETRVGAHVLAHLLAQVSGIAVSRNRVQKNPKYRPRPQR